MRHVPPPVSLAALVALGIAATLGLAVMRSTPTPQPARVQFEQGARLLQSGRLMDAVVALETSVRLQPLAPTHVALAQAYAALGRINDAATQYDAAVNLAPRDVPTRMNRANIRRDRRQPAAALEDYVIVLRLAPERDDAHLGAIDCLLALNRAAEALPRRAASPRAPYASPG